MHNSTVHDGSFGHYGNCPHGEFVLGRPERRHRPKYGEFFTPVSDAPGHHAMREHRRGGIGVHGGGSGLRHPYVDKQGFVPTFGCLRLLNIDNREFVRLVHLHHACGGICYLTVQP